MSKQILFVTLFAVFTEGIVTVDIPCGEPSKLELNEIIQAISVLGDPDRRYPTNDQEAIRHCEEDKRMIWWGGNYTARCLTTQEVEMSRRVTNLMMYSKGKVINKRCRTDLTRAKFINAGKCGNTVQNETIKCFEKYVLETEQINVSKRTSIKEKHLFPLICCAYHRFYDCCSQVYDEPQYGEACTDTAKTALKTYIKESLYDVIQYLCGDYQGSNDKCHRLHKQYEDIYDMRVGLKPVAKSPMGPSNEVFDSLP